MVYYANCLTDSQLQPESTKDQNDAKKTEII